MWVVIRVSARFASRSRGGLAARGRFRENDAERDAEMYHPPFENAPINTRQPIP